MYVRTDAHTLADGEVRRYLSLAHNVVEKPVTGRKRAKPLIFANLGREDELDKAIVDQMTSALERYRLKRFGPRDGDAPAVDVLAATLRAQQPALRLLASRSFGLRKLVERAWEALGLAEALRKVTREHVLAWDLERVVFAMVLHRIVDPGSKLACNDWVRDDAWFPEGDDWDVHHFYRALDLLDAHADAIVAALRKVMTATRPVDALELMLVDTTSTYFETDADDVAVHDDDVALRRRGHSKDHRSDVPQVVIGLASDRYGLPLFHKVYPGNQSDQATTLELVREARHADQGRRWVVAADSGMSGGPNLKALDEDGADRVTGVPFRTLAFAEDRLLAKAGRWAKRPDKPGFVWRVLNVPATESPSGRAELWIATRNIAECARQQKQIHAHVARVEAELAKEDRHDGHGRPMCRVLTKRELSRFVVHGAGDRLRVDRDRERIELRRAGVKVIRSTLVDLPPVESVKIYDALLEVERDFRTLKGPVALRPVYHRKPERIRAHVMVCMLALACVRWLEIKSGLPLGDLRRVFGPVRASKMAQGEAMFWQREEWSTEAEEILGLLGVEVGARTWTGDGSKRGEARRSRKSPKMQSTTGTSEQG